MHFRVFSQQIMQVKMTGIGEETVY